MVTFSEGKVIHYPQKNFPFLYHLMAITSLSRQKWSNVRLQRVGVAGSATSLH